MSIDLVKGASSEDLQTPRRPGVARKAGMNRTPEREGLTVCLRAEHGQRVCGGLESEETRPAGVHGGAPIQTARKAPMLRSPTRGVVAGIALAAALAVSGCTINYDPTRLEGKTAMVVPTDFATVNSVLAEAGFPTPIVMQGFGLTMAFERPVYVETRCVIMYIEGSATILAHEYGNCAEHYAEGFDAVRDPAKSDISDEEMMDIFTRVTGQRIRFAEQQHAWGEMPAPQPDPAPAPTPPSPAPEPAPAVSPSPEVPGNQSGAGGPPQAGCRWGHELECDR